jgi:hypothetical protein
MASSPVTITGLATFFIKNRPGSGIASTIDGEFIYMTVPAAVVGQQQQHPRSRSV